MSASELKSREFIRQTISDAHTAWNKRDITDEQLQLLHNVYGVLLMAHEDLGETGLHLDGYRNRLQEINNMIERRKRN